MNKVIIAALTSIALAGSALAATSPSVSFNDTDVVVNQGKSQAVEVADGNRKPGGNFYTRERQDKSPNRQPAGKKPL
ncbi:hypothetical protein [Ensifer sp. LC163]|uniref:hypothetical protein n=1 Tax=Ensifer sp. LC163 TaxID=1120652 RepID=UPI0008132483|nr:hypothetical protein [Ensifer sp. LC163]OCP38762.1 hypothetical protein BC360_01535 [Ensifer sp. LC163]